LATPVETATATGAELALDDEIVLTLELEDVEDELWKVVRRKSSQRKADVLKRNLPRAKT